MNALIVDDERLARGELTRLLSEHQDIRVVAEAKNVLEAELALRSADVHLMFLDVHMPGGSGFDLLERMDDLPIVIFTTAYDQHAVRAFEVNALDYLLKPIEPERLAVALDRARAEHSSSGASPQPARLERVFVREGERCWIVALSDVRLFESEGNYTRVHFGTNRPLILRSLQALEDRLDTAVFFRASRSHIVNLRCVENVETDVNGGYILTLSGGMNVPVSRRQSRKLRESLSL